MLTNTVIFSAILVTVISVNEDFPKLCNEEVSNKTCICFEDSNQDNYFPELTVDCRGNGLVSVKEDNYSFVSNLDYSLNELSQLDHSEFLMESEKLLTLKFSNNEISFIDSKYFAQLPNLKILLLDHNKITTLEKYMFSGLDNLEILDLSFNKLIGFSDGVFQTMKTLKRLNLGHNELGPHIMEVEKDGGFFGPFLGVNGNLVSLNLDGNQLENLPRNFFENAKALQELSLADNQFKEIPNIPSTVEDFDLSGNFIGLIAARDLNYYSLKVLKLERMKNLTTIDRYAFYNIGRLEYLSLAYNHHLTDFEPLAFGLLVEDLKLNLKTLSLKGCRLEHLHSNYSELFSYIENVDLTFNPWMCDCDLQWLRGHKNVLSDHINIKCATPSSVSEESLLLTDLPTCGSSAKTHKILLSIMAVLIITLVFLIGYLIYMSPFSYKNRRGVGMNSPYKNVLVNEY